MNYTQKPITVDAFRYGVDLWPDWFHKELAEGKARILDGGDEFVIPSCLIDGERPMICAEGDYLVRFEDGETICLSPTRFHERFEGGVTHKKTSTSTAVVKVPPVLEGAYGDELSIEVHFVDGSCHPHFLKGFDKDTEFRQVILEALYESESFQPLSSEGAVSLLRQVMTRYLKDATSLQIL